MQFVYLMFTYFVASIPFGLIIGFLGYNTDIRKVGSKNIGMTNVWRTLGLGPALWTLLGDAGKGWMMVYFAPTRDIASLTLIALTAVLGHCYSIFLQGKGGKGVATAFGVLLAIDCRIALWLLSVWMIVRYLSQKSSLSAFVALSTLPFLILYYNSHYWFLGLTLPLFIVWQHRDNIERFRNGTES